MNDLNSDEKLIEQCRLGDPAALDHIMNKYKPLVIKKSRSMFLIGGETEDLIQEGMIGLFKAVQDYQTDRDSSFYSLAKLCIERQIYSAVTMAGRKKHSPLNGYISLSHSDDFEFEENSVSSAILNPEETIIDRERMWLIQQKLTQKLSSLEAAVLDLFLKGYSYVQMADRLGKKEKSIDNALHRIKNKLQLILNDMDK